MNQEGNLKRVGELWGIFICLCFTPLLNQQWSRRWQPMFLAPWYRGSKTDFVLKELCSSILICLVATRRTDKSTCFGFTWFRTLSEKWLHRGHSLKILKGNWRTHSCMEQVTEIWETIIDMPKPWEENLWRVFEELQHWKSHMYIGEYRKLCTCPEPDVCSEKTWEDLKLSPETDL